MTVPPEAVTSPWLQRKHSKSQQREPPLSGFNDADLQHVRQSRSTSHRDTKRTCWTPTTFSSKFFCPSVPPYPILGLNVGNISLNNLSDAVAPKARWRTIVRSCKVAVLSMEKKKNFMSKHKQERTNKVQ